MLIHGSELFFCEILGGVLPVRREKNILGRGEGSLVPSTQTDMLPGAVGKLS